MKSKAAFSKKDLVVVLAGVLFVVLNIGAIGSGGRRRAKEMVCLSNLRQWGAIFEMFTNDNDGYFNRGWDVGETELWMNALRPYYHDNRNLLLCPEAARVAQSTGYSGTFRAWWRDIDLPDGDQHSYVSSYGINSWTNNMTSNSGSGPKEWFWKNVRGVEGKNNIPVFLDSSWHDGWPWHTSWPPAYDGQPPMATYNDMVSFCINRHNGGVSMLFMDWSARKIGLKELWTLKWHRQYNTDGPWTKAGGVQPSDWPYWMRNFRDY